MGTRLPSYIDRHFPAWPALLAFSPAHPALLQWGFVLLLVPLGLDGRTHIVSDLAGLGQGVRDSHAWLAALTGNALPADFQAGDALGSFNGWMRIISDMLFALGMVWMAFPYLDRSMAHAAAQIEAKFSRAGVNL